jgi:hypothetical protein
MVCDRTLIRSLPRYLLPHSIVCAKDKVPAFAKADESEMVDADYIRKLDELERLLNDPCIPLDPVRIWSLLAEVSKHVLSLAPIARQRRHVDG